MCCARAPASAANFQAAAGACSLTAINARTHVTAFVLVGGWVWKAGAKQVRVTGSITVSMLATSTRRNRVVKGQALSKTLPYTAAVSKNARSNGSSTCHEQHRSRMAYMEAKARHARNLTEVCHTKSGRSDEMLRVKVSWKLASGQEKHSGRLHWRVRKELLQDHLAPLSCVSAMRSPLKDAFSSANTSAFAGSYMTLFLWHFHFPSHLITPFDCPHPRINSWLCSLQVPSTDYYSNHTCVCHLLSVAASIQTKVHHFCKRPNPLAGSWRILEAQPAWHARIWAMVQLSTASLLEKGSQSICVITGVGWHSLHVEWAWDHMTFLLDWAAQHLLRQLFCCISTPQ